MGCLVHHWSNRSKRCSNQTQQSQKNHRTEHKWKNTEHKWTLKSFARKTSGTLTDYRNHISKKLSSVLESHTWSIQHSRLRGHDQLSGPAEFLECLENHSKKTATFGVTNISFTSSLAQKGEFPLQLDFLKYAVLSK